MRIYVFFSWIRFIISVCLALFVLGGVCLFNLSAFPFYGDKEYYLYSASSQAEIRTELSFSDFFFLKGERARVETSDGYALFQETLIRYDAKVLKMEEGDFGVSYYCYSPKLKNGLLLDGQTVNLQIVIKRNEVLLATPIIFGGY